jgi:hypothetical protein
MRVVCAFDFINHINCVAAINDAALFTSVDAKAGYGMCVFCKSSLLGDFFDFVTPKRRSQVFATENLLRDVRKNLKCA